MGVANRAEAELECVDIVIRECFPIRACAFGASLSNTLPLTL